jgi:hypothetical protein
VLPVVKVRCDEYSQALGSNRMAPGLALLPIGTFRQNISILRKSGGRRYCRSSKSISNISCALKAEIGTDLVF